MEFSKKYFNRCVFIDRSVYSQEPEDLKKKQRPEIGQEVVVQSGSSWLRGHVERINAERRVASVSLTDMVATYEFPGNVLWNVSDELSVKSVLAAVAKCYLEVSSSSHIP